MPFGQVSRFPISMRQSRAVLYVIVPGDPRTYVEECVLPSWRKLIGKHRGNSQVGVLDFLTLEDGGPKGRQKSKFPAVGADIQAVLIGLLSIKASMWCV